MKIHLNYLTVIITKGFNIIFVAEGRIELPTPCFSDRGKPFVLN